MSGLNTQRGGNWIVDGRQALVDDLKADEDLAEWFREENPEYFELLMEDYG